MNRYIAVIPAKARSTRVPKKNFRNFYCGDSLLEIKVKQCLMSGCFDDVYVSSDTDEAKELVEPLGAQFLKRAPELCLDDTPWSAVLLGVLDQVPVSDDVYVAWTPLTSPLFNDYRGAINMLEESPTNDSVMTVTKMQHFFLNSDHIPLNFQYGVWASYTQAIKPLYQMNCALWLATKGSIIQNRFQVGDRPLYFETSMTAGIDIDTMEEFEFAQLLYRHYQGRAE